MWHSFIDHHLRVSTGQCLGRMVIVTLTKQSTSGKVSHIISGAPAKGPERNNAWAKSTILASPQIRQMMFAASKTHDSSEGSMNETVAILTHRHNDTRIYSFSWRINRAHKGFSLQSIDLVIVPLNVAPDRSDAAAFQWPAQLHKGPQWVEHNLTIRTFIEKALEHSDSSRLLAIKLLVPISSGYVAQSNIFETRFYGCPRVEAVASFFKPGEFIRAPDRISIDGPAATLDAMLASTVGAVRLSPVEAVATWRVLDALDNELRNRMAVRFLLPDPIPRKRVGLVFCPPENTLSFELLLHLGIEVVIFDEPGHYMEDPIGPAAYLRSSFHSLDFTPDDGLAQRLYEATQSLQLDGLTSRIESYLPVLARVSAMLGISYASEESLKVATNKYLFRGIVQHNDPAGHPIIKCTNASELQDRIESTDQPLHIEYPVVVKPTQGHFSWGVFKATDKTSLLAAVKTASKLRMRPTHESVACPEVLIEPYVEGPEIDVNIAMLDGKILFSDIADNAPTPGDSDTVGESGSLDFQERLFMYPSRLPEAEKAQARDYLHECILRLGFRSGVFHCEARIRDSTMRYALQESSGVVDLQKNQVYDALTRQPSTFVIEINCRPPGYYGLYATTRTYGVDLWGLYILHAIGDDARFRALAMPFADGPQHDCAVVLVLPEKGGILRSADPVPRLRKKYQNLTTCIPLYRNFYKTGDAVPSPASTMSVFVSIVNIESKLGREHLMIMAEDVRRECTPVIE